MDERIFGYVRVSSKDQNEDRQIIAMEEFGVPPKNMVCEKLSGKDFNRPGYRKLIRKMRAGDILVIKSIDRLGRNYEEILEQWRKLTKEKQIAIVVLDMPLLDTRQGRDLTGTLIADIVLQILSYVAQAEREATKQRQREGIAIAKREGKYKGRKPKEPDNFAEVYSEWINGKITAVAASRVLGISRGTFYNKAEKYRIKLEVENGRRVSE